jgi:phytoene/squalene synthetase
MKAIFDTVSFGCSKIATRTYSTSFSLGIYFLDKKFHAPIYAIYGFVRFADEIVDSFHEYDKAYLLSKFKSDAYESIEAGISLNPILNSFQSCVIKYGLEKELIDSFLDSMMMDLDQQKYDKETYEKYIFGSAEVVGLMCLRVFTEGDHTLYERLKPFAIRLGAAFQKVNFLRDMNADFVNLGRSYFPDINLRLFSIADKKKIEQEISDDFDEALKGIKMLPVGAKQGVYLAYVYYKALFEKIKRIPVESILKKRISVSTQEKFYLMLNSIIRDKINVIR